MSFRRLLPLVAPLVLAACGAPRAAIVAPAQPALWVARDADTTVYLFGSIHALKPGLGWFDDGVKAAFDKSDQLVLELVAPPPDQMTALVRELGGADRGPTLSQQLPPETGREIREALTRAGQPETQLEHDKPWLAAIALSNLPVEALGYDTDQGVETILSQAAAKQGKPVLGLETAREQLGYFDRLSPAAQRTFLNGALAGIPTAGKKMDAAVAAWSKGDADGLARLINEDLKASPELRNALIGERNRHWADWIAARMRRPGTVFIAVGAGHLAGPLALQAMLAKRGVKFERMGKR